MSRINLVVGALFGLSVVTNTVLFNDAVRSKLDDDLMEKAIPVPAVVDENGKTLRDATTRISVIDRRDSEAAWEAYLDGYRWIGLHAFALIALGLVAAQAKCPPKLPLAGGVLFTLGILLFGYGKCLAVAFADPTLAIGVPIGAILLIGGWICLTITAAFYRPAV